MHPQQIKNNEIRVLLPCGVSTINSPSDLKAELAMIESLGLIPYWPDVKKVEKYLDSLDKKGKS